MYDERNKGMTNHSLTPMGWEDYELIDSGGFEKLERFGKLITRRPEPQALWHKSLPEQEWVQLAGASFCRDGAGRNAGDERGKWSLKKDMPEQWWINYRYKGMSLKMRLGLTSFKHVGVFPEQASNWDFIYDKVGSMAHQHGQPVSVLNLFAYTGGATLAAKAAGADVTHVDSVKQVVTWAKENMEASGLDGVRWIIDDALKFVRREVKRERLYDGIILDPPAYGRGPDGEKWTLEDGLIPLLECCARLLRPGGFMILNLYSMGLSPMIARTAVRAAHGRIPENEQAGELYFADRSGKVLPLGIFYRF